MKRVAVLGGGPAGAFAAERLAEAGVSVVLFDEKLAWEKPCGGGLTYKAYERYPFLLENDRPKKLIATTVLSLAGAGEAALELRHPLLVYSRYELNLLLLERAARAGAQVEKARVLEMRREAGRWRLRTTGGVLEADHCIVATGARNPLRGFGAALTAADAMCALGYYIPARQEHISVHFLPQFEGYIWLFPRCGHLSAGICGKNEPAWAMRRRLESFLGERGIPWKDGRFYSHVLPSLTVRAWWANRVEGDGWHAVGDAAGLVDPITGEGLYYALRSADLAAQALVTGRPYQRALYEDCAGDLAFAAGIASRFYRGRFLRGGVTERMIQFTRRSPRFAGLMRDMFDGSQNYSGLKRRLLRNLSASVAEIALNTGNRRRQRRESERPA
jgi:flavin-dependent dehydrogenase